MTTKIFTLITSAAICFFGIVSCQTTPTACDDYKTYELFSCDKDHLASVKMSDLVIPCPDDYLCNTNFKESEFNGTMVCTPCIESSRQCQFQCVNDTTFSIGQQVLNCPSTHVCNRKSPKVNCSPCIREACEADAWTCDPTNEAIFTTKYSKGECLNGFVCRKEKFVPCNQYCIDPTGKRRSRSNYDSNVVFYY